MDTDSAEQKSESSIKIPTEVLQLPKEKRKKRKPAEKAKSTSIKTLKESGFIAAENVENLIKSFTASAEEKKEGKKPKALSLYIDKSKGIIFAPKALESIVADLFIRKSLEVAFRAGIKMESCPGDYKPIPDGTDVTFWNGFFEELTSKKKVTKIHFSKSNIFQNGRAAARYECLKSLTPADNQSWLRHIHKEITGDQKQIKPILERMIGKRFEEKERQDAFHFVKDLAGLVTTLKDYGLEKFEMKNFFDSFGDHLASCKRKKRKFEKTNRRTKEKLTTVSATKPSVLKTVLPFEKSAVEELWEEPWKKLEVLRLLFEKTKPHLVDRSSLLKKIRKIIDDQWRNKQVVLRQTKHRTVPLGPTARFNENINNTAKVLSVIKTEDAYLSYIAQKERTVAIFPVGPFVDGKETHTSFIAFLNSEGKERYPMCSAILQCHKEAGVIKGLQKAELSEPDPSKKRKTEVAVSSNPYNLEGYS